ncbi:unnamed protein product [Prunus armeniaca]|uniref:Uncharacterized protein n=2 Tax=Prunus armeniaca TaxID=36596 RepID=A0A6J5WIS1_PRUAR|nr:unnamed protein product [Prunus armeniaca]
MAMNHFQSNTNNIFVNQHHHQLQFITYFPAQQTMPLANSASTFMIYHCIFGFTIPTAMTLVQVRFPDQNLFHANPILMLLMLCSVVTYSLAFSLELLLLSLRVNVRATPHVRNWSIASGSVSLASVLGLLLSPPSSWPWLPLLLCFLLLTLLAFALKLVPLVHQLLSRFSRATAAAAA